MESGASWHATLQRLSGLLADTPPESVGEVCARLLPLRITLTEDEASALSSPFDEVAARAAQQRLVDRLRHVFDCSSLDAATLLNLVRALLERCADQAQSRLAQERMEMLSAASFEGIAVHVNGVVIDANRRMVEMFGYADRGELLGPGAMQRCIVPEDIPAVAARFAAGDEGAYVVGCVRKDGSRFRAEVLSKQARLGAQPVRIAAIRDVTERERTSQLLRESEERLRVLAEQAFDFVVISRDGFVADVGGAVERVIGHPREQLIGRLITDFVWPSSLPLARQIIADKELGAHTLSLRHANGEPVPVAFVIANSSLNGQPVRVAGVRDQRQIQQLEAERRKLEQQVERTQRLQSLGVLAGGIAHDFNNLLVGVLGNANLLLERTRDPADREALEAIAAAGRRAADLTSQMLAYAGQRDLGRREAVDLGALCRELHTLLGAALSKKARVQLAIETGCVALGDRATLTQPFMNLMTNASDALEDKSGDIHVRIRRVQRPDARWQHALGTNAERTGDWLLVEIEDTGRGMDEATRERAFEPFFSTKAKGHGLGLAASVGIVAAHRGAMLVESSPGKGSCFSVLLPAADPGASRPPAGVVKPKATPARDVLIVDDEALVRTQMRRSLEVRGYSVREAKDGHAALAAVSVTAPDVMVLDLTMPELDGAEVVRLLRASGSRVPIVLSSGYADVTVERKLNPSEFQAFLPKPFGVQELVDAIERALRVAASASA